MTLAGSIASQPFCLPPKTRRLLFTMQTPPPRKTRRAARAIVLTECPARVLLLRHERPDQPGDFWLLPGGGCKRGESSLSAVRRELCEETGLALNHRPPLVWKRKHVFARAGVVTEQHEDIYLVRTGRFQPTSANNVDLSEVGIFVEFRWWAAAEILASEEVFGPRDLGRLLADLLAHGAPASPLDI